MTGMTERWLNFTVGLCLACLSYFFYKLLDIAEKSWSKREWWTWPPIYSEKNLAENISVFIHAKVDQIDRQLRSWGLVCREEGGDQGANGKSFSFRGNKFRCSPISTSLLFQTGAPRISLSIRWCLGLLENGNVFLSEATSLNVYPFFFLKISASIR